MKQEQILEGNRLIAEFMGSKRNESGDLNDTDMIHYNGVGMLGGFLKHFNYHSSWDWLIPVVEKIEEINDDYHGYFGVHISSNSCVIQATNFRPDKAIPNPAHYFSTTTLETKIESAFSAIVDFIKWYNQNSPSQENT